MKGLENRVVGLNGIEQGRLFRDQPLQKPLDQQWMGDDMVPSSQDKGVTSGHLQGIDKPGERLERDGGAG
jgi:hypothetical protein